LIVDDDPMIREMLSAAIEHAGLSITTAGDAEQAFIQARDLKPIVIVSDISMPGADGSTIYKRLRGDPKIPIVPIVFMTGMPLEKARELFPKTEPTIGLMQKPVKVDMIRDYVWKVAGILPMTPPPGGKP
jgi:CheY-like chemotaxis protein